MELLAASALMPLIATLAWISNLLRGSTVSARARHQITVLVVTYGITLIPAVVIFVFAGLEVGFVTWGGPDNFWITAGIISSILALVIGAALALADVVLLKFPLSKFIRKGDR